MRNRPMVTAIAVAGLVGLALTACGNRAARAEAQGVATASKAPVFTCPVAAPSAGAASGAAPRGTRLQVVTTVAPLTSLVANIAGDRADVHGVIPEGQDSHTYEPKPSVAKLMSTADIVFVNGLGLEEPTKEIARSNVPNGGQVVELGTLTIRPDEYIYDFSFPKDGGKPNPHLWTNPPMAKCYAAIAASVMAKADPANTAYYADNATRYSARIDELDRLMSAATTAMPSANRELLTYHDAYAYFAAHYGWHVVGAVQVSNFEDPTPKDVAALIDQVRSAKIPAIFGSEVFPSAVLEQIANESGTRYVDKLRDDDLPGAPGDADHSYLGLIKFDFVTIVSNLGGDASALAAFDANNVITDHAEYPQ
jgi:ABC-type Zn uptake system ZnuABC Zn-binding protein ZnuA